MSDFIRQAVANALGTIIGAAAIAVGAAVVAALRGADWGWWIAIGLIVFGVVYLGWTLLALKIQQSSAPQASQWLERTNKVNDLSSHVNNMAAEGSVSQLSKRIDGLIETQKDLPDQVRRLRDEVTPYGEQIQYLRRTLRPSPLVADPTDVLSKLILHYERTETRFGAIQHRLVFRFKALNVAGIDMRTTGKVRGDLFVNAIESFMFTNWGITTRDSTGRLPQGQQEKELVITWLVSDKFLQTIAYKSEGGIKRRKLDVQARLYFDFSGMQFEVEAIDGAGKQQVLGYKALPQGLEQIVIEDEPALERIRGIYDSHGDLGS